MSSTRLIRTPLAFAPALLALSGACKEFDPTPLEPGVDALVVAVAPATVPADGRSVAGVAAVLPDNTKPADAMVTFQTTLGSFGPGGEAQVAIPAVASRAAAQLRAPTSPGTAYVRVTHGTTVRLDSVTFVRAPADELLVEPQRFAIQATLASEMVVNVQLRRTPGVPSLGTEVEFAAHDSTGARIGRFGVASLSDAEGRVQVRFTPGATNYRGPIRIVAATPGRTSFVTGSAVVEVIS